MDPNTVITIKTLDGSIQTYYQTICGFQYLVDLIVNNTVIVPINHYPMCRILNYLRGDDSEKLLISIAPEAKIIGLQIECEGYVYVNVGGIYYFEKKSFLEENLEYFVSFFKNYKHLDPDYSSILIDQCPHKFGQLIKSIERSSGFDRFKLDLEIKFFGYVDPKNCKYFFDTEKISYFNEYGCYYFENISESQQDEFSINHNPPINIGENIYFFHLKSDSKIEYNCLKEIIITENDHIVPLNTEYLIEIEKIKYDAITNLLIFDMREENSSARRRSSKNKSTSIKYTISIPSSITYEKISKQVSIDLNIQEKNSIIQQIMIEEPLDKYQFNISDYINSNTTRENIDYFINEIKLAGRKNILSHIELFVDNEIFCRSKLSCLFKYQTIRDLYSSSIKNPCLDGKHTYHAIIYFKYKFKGNIFVKYDISYCTRKN